MAEPFQLLKKIATEAQLIVYALRLFVYISRLRSVLSSEWVGIWYLGSLSHFCKRFQMDLAHNTEVDLV